MNFAVQPEIKDNNLLNSQELHYAASQNNNIGIIDEIDQTNRLTMDIKANYES